MMTLRFVDDLSSYPSEGAFVARIPAGISGSEELFDVLFQALSLPGYFGFNWNALSDCLRDFHWVAQKRVVILHEDLPSLGESDTREYLDVLITACKDWKPDEPHSLEVVFPGSLRNDLKKVIQIN